MKRVLLAVVTVASVAGGTFLTAVPAAGVGQPKVTAIVVMRSQVDAATVAAGATVAPPTGGPRVSAPTRRQRGAAVERALRARAAATQGDVLALLSRRRHQGLVSAVDPLWIFNGVAVTAAPSVIRELAARRDVREIRPEVTLAAPTAPRAATVGSTVPAASPEANIALVNAPALWDLGYRGQGIVVANLDTGVDATHPDLAGRWRGGTNSWYDPNGQHPTVPTDVNGHGTATMGVLVGGDAGGTSIGMAPDAQWIAAKIFNDRGTATSTGIHQAMQWLLDPDGSPATADAADVVVNSWTMSSGGCTLDFQLDLTNLRAAGILPVFAAGNYGPAPGTVLSPANNPQAFAVGAVDNADTIDPSSSRGPSACGGALAPQLVAPGVGVHTTDLYGGYIDASGTSLAAPHVAGGLALLLSAFPDLTADRQAAGLENGTVDLGAAGPDNDYGYGRLDVLAAEQWLRTAPDVTLAVSPSAATTTPGGSVSYAVDVAGVNGFTGDVTLALAGLSTAQASWTFSPPVVPGATGTAQLVVTTAATLAAGTYPLTIIGTSGALTRSAPATLTVSAPPDFTVTAAPASLAVVAGTGAAYTVSVGSVNGFSGTVALSLSGLPASVGSASFSPPTIAGAGNSQLTVTTSATAASGSYPLTITAASGATVHQAVVTLAVTARDFTLAMSPSSITVYRLQSAKYTVSVASTTGFTGAVSLTVAGLPAGASASFSPNPVTSPGSSTLTVRTTGSTPRGTFTLLVTGTSGSLTHQAAVTLTVR
jgi:subtilisin family serine protease